MESMLAEVVVKPKQPFFRNLICCIIYIAMAIFFVIACRSAILSHVYAIITFALPFEITIIALTTFFFRRGRIEYEYDFCDNVLLIVKIINKNKRVNLAKIEMENVEACMPIQSSMMDKYKSYAIKDFGPAKREKDMYALVTVLNNQNVRLYIEPSEKLLYCLRMRLGQRFTEL
ncbi:MAG: hypothetical protein II073_00325 [Lachnospiraceae bacterium]|nr:hypothetical protein [Lachnospiraceae bacterium]